MSLVWTIIATFLYIEIGVVLLLVLPIASPLRWHRFFKSQFLAMIGRQAHIYFVLLLGILVLFLLEAIREMRKYSHSGKWFNSCSKNFDQQQILPSETLIVFIWTESNPEHPTLEMQHSMRLFRAQRNFYISGFSIFLVLVIRRLVTLISSQATLLAQSEASMRQAQSATTAARSLLSQQKTDDKSVDPKEAAKSNELVCFNGFFFFFGLPFSHVQRFVEFFPLLFVGPTIPHFIPSFNITIDLVINVCACVILPSSSPFPLNHNYSLCEIFACAWINVKHCR